MFLPSSVVRGLIQRNVAALVGGLSYFHAAYEVVDHPDSVHTRARGWLSHRAAPQASPCNITVILCEAVRCRRVGSLRPRRSERRELYLLHGEGRGTVSLQKIRVPVDHGLGGKTVESTRHQSQRRQGKSSMTTTK